MANPKKTDLEAFEKQFGLTVGDLTYQERCARMKESLKTGEVPVEKVKPKLTVTEGEVNECPAYGQTLLITPLMTTDKDRALAYDEFVGYEVEYEEVNAGERIYGTSKDVKNMVGDYDVKGVNYSKPVYAKTTFPKAGTELTYKVGQKLPVPLVKGNDGKRGYLWSFPTQTVSFEYEDETYFVQLFGLKNIIENIAPELLPKFKHAPVMSYIDGLTLAASIPQTDAILSEWMRQKRIDKRAGVS